MSKIVHIVHLRFQPDATEEAVQRVCHGFAGFRTLCLHPETKKPYIISVAGGKDTSIEGLQRGYTHTFILEFRSSEDRDYYIKDDPAHQAFSTSAAGVVESDVMAMDFTPGLF